MKKCAIIYKQAVGKIALTFFLNLFLQSKQYSFHNVYLFRHFEQCCVCLEYNDSLQLDQLEIFTGFHKKTLGLQD